MLDRLETELPERAFPTVPAKWSQIAGITISFGHGLSVTPMQTAVATAALMNGGDLIPPTFFPRTAEEAQELATPVVSEETSLAMRQLFRLNALKGTGKRAQVPGYRVGGKTGTADKVVNGRYATDKRFNSFLSAFPMDDPRYVVLVVLDEPKPEKGQPTATAGLNTAPTVANIVSRIGPMLRIEPKFEEESGPLLAAFGN
jgi:cell division protein FtsI (penicillin-binding protein 3)